MDVFYLVPLQTIAQQTFLDFQRRQKLIKHTIGIRQRVREVNSLQPCLKSVRKLHRKQPIRTLFIIKLILNIPYIVTSPIPFRQII